VPDLWLMARWLNFWARCQPLKWWEAPCKAIS
jgi:hypothetical protein